MLVAVAFWLVAASVARADDSVTPMCNGQQCAQGTWYTSPVTLTWTVNPPANSYYGCGGMQPSPGDVLTTTSCRAVWTGDDISRSYTLHVETSTPTATANPARPPDSGGWYNHPVAVSFGGSSFSGFAFCTPTTTYAGPDVSNATVSGSCTDHAGKAAGASLGLQYDATPPKITAVSPSRRPDHHGWYNHPVKFSVHGTDAGSGIERCATVTYSGPDSGHAVVIASCSDRAGNVTVRRVPLRYEGTPPSVRFAAEPGDEGVLLHWRTGPSTSSLVITRSPGVNGARNTALYHGKGTSYHDRNVRNGVRYRYTLTARDQAGNVSSRTITVTPDARLLAPAEGATVSGPPLLEWTPAPGAGYYNVQIYRAGKKILNTWPARPRLQLGSAWSYAGRHIRLVPGVYRWYVWPGLGSRAAARYGPMIGSGTFTVRRPR